MERDSRRPVSIHVSSDQGQPGAYGLGETDFIFTADNSSDLIRFLSVGTPAGVPPFALLDGVNMTATPEPGTVAMMMVGQAEGFSVLRYRRERQ